MGAKCKKCQRETELEDCFHAVRGNFGSRNFQLCPQCHERREAREGFGGFLLTLAVTPIIVWGALLMPDKPITMVIANACLFFLVIGFPLILLHELGHAIASKLCGFTIHSIQIGGGPRVASFKTGEVRWSLHALATIGLCSMAPASTEHFRKRFAVVIAAGPLVNLAILLSMLAITPATQFFSWKPITTGISIPWILFWSNLLIFYRNILPRKIKSPQGVFSSDGKQLLRLLTDRQKLQDETHAAFFQIKCIQALEAEDIVAAKNWAEEACTLYPDDATSLLFFSHVLFEHEDYAGVREALLPLLDRTDLQPLVLGTAKNNIAYAAALRRDPDYYSEADTLSAEAVEQTDSSPAVLGTRGAVLYRLGRAEEAERLFESAHDGTADRKRRAAQLCWLALSQIDQQKFQAAQSAFDQAKEFDSKCKLLAEVEQQLSETKT